MHRFLTVPRDAQEHCQAFIHLQDLSHRDIQVLSACVLCLNCHFCGICGNSQGGRSWQPFGKGKNGHKKFSSGVSCNCYFCDKCVVFARNCKFANLIQYDMQYIRFNNALLAQETLSLFSPQSPKKCVTRDKF